MGSGTSRLGRRPSRARLNRSTRSRLFSSLICGGSSPRSTLEVKQYRCKSITLFLFLILWSFLMNWDWSFGFNDRSLLFTWRKKEEMESRSFFFLFFFNVKFWSFTRMNFHFAWFEIDNLMLKVGPFWVILRFV